MRLVSLRIIAGLLCYCLQSQAPAATQAVQNILLLEVNIEANDLFSSLKKLSAQTQRAIFFAPELDNKTGYFSFKGTASPDEICQRIGEFYQVSVTLVERAILVAKLPIDAQEPASEPQIKSAPEKQLQTNQPEEVIVTASLEKSREERGYRSNQDATPNQSIRVESLSLMNAASYPVNNLAESLLNISGVTANFDGGEGRQIAMRGLAGDFVHVSLNDMPTLAVHGSSLDSREQNERALAFDFNLLPSELFERVDVVRDYSVSQDSGGIAGNISLYTSAPTNLASQSYYINALIEQNYNDLSAQTGHRAAVSWQYKQDNWFYMLAASINRKVTQEQGYNTYRWRKLDIADTDISALEPEIQQLLAAQQIYFPRGNRYSVWLNDIEQTGLVAALHYDNSNWSHKFDWIQTRLDNTKQEYHLATRGIHSTAMSKQTGQATQISHLEIDARQYLRYASFEQAQLATESRLLDKNTEFEQLTWAGRYSVETDIEFAWLFGISQSEQQIPNDQKVYLTGFSGLVTDYRDEPVNHYQMDLLNLDNWRLDEIDLTRNQYLVRQKLAKFTFDYDKSESHWQAGFQVKQFLDSRSALEKADLFKTEFKQGDLNNRLTAQLSNPVSEHTGLSWLGVNNKQVTPTFLSGIDWSAEDLINNDSYRIQRTSSALWLQYNYLKSEHSLDAGIRFEQIKREVDSNQLSAPLTATDYLGLFSVNYRYALTENWQTRLNLNQNITPVQTKYFNPARFYLSALDTYQTGRINLKPYQSTQFSAQLQGKPLANADISATLYTKYIDGLINYQQTNDLLADQVSPVNQARSQITGLDISLSYQFTPALSVRSDYSYAQGQRRYRYSDLFNYQGELEGLSNHLLRLELGYQTADWGSLWSMTYRSDYISEIKYERLQQDQVETGFLPYKRLNWSAYYKLNSHLEVNLGIRNLTNEVYREYAGQHQYLYNTTETGRQYYLRWVLMI